jgi:hypothetical protein
MTIRCKYVALLACAVTACATHREAYESEHCPPPPHIALARWAPIDSLGVIEGRVLRVASVGDTAPKPLPDTQVQAIGPVQRGIVVDTAGRFRLTNLPVGEYLVRVRRFGFPERLDSLRIDATGYRGEIRLGPELVLFPCCRGICF